MSQPLRASSQEAMMWTKNTAVRQQQRRAPHRSVRVQFWLMYNALHCQREKKNQTRARKERSEFRKERNGAWRSLMRPHRSNTSATLVPLTTALWSSPPQDAEQPQSASNTIHQQSGSTAESPCLPAAGQPKHVVFLRTRLRKRGAQLQGHRCQETWKWLLGRRAALLWTWMRKH